MHTDTDLPCTCIRPHARKRQLDLGYSGEGLYGDIAVLSAYNRQLSADEVEAVAQGLQLPLQPRHQA